MKRQEMVDLVMEVDHDGSGEVEYAEFLEIMTTTLQRLAEESETSNKAEGQVRGWGGEGRKGDVPASSTPTPMPTPLSAPSPSPPLPSCHTFTSSST